MTTNNVLDTPLPLSKANGGTGVIVSSTLVQVVTATIAATNGNTATPFVSTAALITYGFQIATLTITPTTSTSILDIYATCSLCVDPSTNGSSAIILHRDGGNGIAASSDGTPGTNTGLIISLRKRVVSGSTSSTTFTLRVGDAAGSTLSVNEYNASGIFGGVAPTLFTIREYLS